MHDEEELGRETLARIQEWLINTKKEMLKKNQILWPI